MDTATGIIPEELFTADQKPYVIAFLVRLVMPSKQKSRIFKDWSKWTGATITPAEHAQVEASGLDAPPEIKLPGE